MENLALLQDLGWLMVAAAVAGILFQRLNQPVILGYLLAGVFLGPNLLPNSPIHDLANIRALSELGVLFLMFYIGLEFDIGKLRRVFAPAALALCLQTLVMVFVAFQVGVLLGWGSVESLFLGGILSISSSMVTVKFIRERGDMNRPYAEGAVAILILEDILAIVLLVVLTGVAVNGRLAWNAVGEITFFVGVFVVVVFLLGKLLAPRAVELLQRVGTAETVTLFTIGLILGVSLLAERFEFSLALGGFLAGAILSKSSLAKEIESLTEPLRDFFCALFFVSVGMLIDPKEMLAHWLLIVTLTAVVIVGKFAACWLGLILAGRKPALATQASLAKVSIGEFSFIIAALGLSLGVTDPVLKALASGTAILTIFLTPLVNALGRPLNDFVRRKTPVALRNTLDIYLNRLEVVRTTLKRSGLLRFGSRPFFRVVVGFLLLNGLVIVVSVLIAAVPVPDRLARWTVDIQRGLWGVAALICIPVFVDVVRNINVIAVVFTEAATEGYSASGTTNRIFREIFQWGAFSVILAVFGLVFLGAAAPYFPSGSTVALFLTVCILLAVFFWRRVVHLHSRLENAVLQAMENQAHALARASMEEAISRATERNPWPVRIEDFELPKQCCAVGVKIKDLNLRSETGVTIVAVERAGMVHQNPSPDYPLSPGDRLYLLGEPLQLEAAVAMLSAVRTGPAPEKAPETISLDKAIVGPTSEFVGLSLKEANLKQSAGITVVGIHRGDQKIVGPKGDDVLNAGDLLLVLGNAEDVARFRDGLVQPD